jgi:mannose-6-phosphate isomerase-like protein (cupin superfamily)
LRRLRLEVIVTGRPGNKNTLVEKEIAMVTTDKSTAQVYNFRTPYLKQGRTTDLRAKTDLMTVMVKVYAEGGENAMHYHSTEDHTFFVLEGQATFHLGEYDNTVVVNRYEGVMLPKGAVYCFESSGEGNLVMIRIGATPPGPRNERLAPDGHPLPGDSLENKSVERIEMPGKGFGG